MSSDRPNAAPPRDTISIQRSSGSAVLALQSCRSAGGTSSRVLAAGGPRPAAPGDRFHPARENAAPPAGGRGGWRGKGHPTAGGRGLDAPLSFPPPSFL